MSPFIFKNNFISKDSSCPLCGSEKTSENIVNRFGVILKCHDCTFLFSRNRASEVSELFNSSVKTFIQKAYNNQSLTRNFFGSILAGNLLFLCKSKQPKLDMLIDIGCGQAQIGHFIINKKLNIKYFGIECNKKIYDSLPKKLRGSVIHKSNIFAAIKRVQPSDYSVFVLNHVLEHLETPRETLDMLFKKMRAGNLIYIEVPNEQWKRIQIFCLSLLKNSKLPWFPGHINFFEYQSLFNVLNAIGFEIVFSEKARIADNYYTYKDMISSNKSIIRNFFTEIFYYLLKITFLEKLLNYGIVLRFLCRKN